MTAQLERLHNDVAELEEYVQKLKRRGKTNLVPKINEKKNFLLKHIAEKQQVMQ